MRTSTTRISIYTILLAAVIIIAPAIAASTSVHVVKLANDGVTVLNQTTVNYQWMESNLPVLGDETTDYYLQGPVFLEKDGTPRKIRT